MFKKIFLNIKKLLVLILFPLCITLFFGVSIMMPWLLVLGLVIAGVYFLCGFSLEMFGNKLLGNSEAVKLKRKYFKWLI